MWEYYSKICKELKLPMNHEVFEHRFFYHKELKKALSRVKRDEYWNLGGLSTKYCHNSYRELSIDNTSRDIALR